MWSWGFIEKMNSLSVDKQTNKSNWIEKAQNVPIIKTALINETLLAGGYGVKIIFKLTLSNRIKPG